MGRVQTNLQRRFGIGPARNYKARLCDTQLREWGIGNCSVWSKIYLFLVCKDDKQMWESDTLKGDSGTNRVGGKAWWSGSLPHSSNIAKRHYWGWDGKLEMTAHSMETSPGTTDKTEFKIQKSSQIKSTFFKGFLSICIIASCFKMTRNERQRDRLLTKWFHGQCTRRQKLEICRLSFQLQQVEISLLWFQLKQLEIWKYENVDICGDCSRVNLWTIFPCFWISIS